MRSIKRIIFKSGGLLIFLLMSSLSRTDTIKTIYFLPGQGSDKRIFDSLSIDAAFNINHIKYDTVSTNMSLSELAHQLTSAIDTSEKFALVGVSMGGMICAELSEILNPEKVIIISSAKNRNELPGRYRFQRVIPLYAICPARVLLWGAKVLQPLVEPASKNNEEAFKTMLSAKTDTYMKISIRMIIRWKREANKKKITHIHGSNDHTIPLRNVENPDFVIENGSHMMTLTRPEEVSLVLNKVLLD